jgi:ribosomal protein S18 acetylase RimI-like enzyme
MTEFEVRRVSLADTRDLRQRVLRPHATADELATHEPAGAVAFGAFTGPELVAVGLVGADGDPGDWRVRGMATASEARGRGAGTAILQALVEYAIAHGATRVWCNARTPALNLYRRVGFLLASEEFFPPEIGPHFRVELPVSASRG